MVEAYSDQYRFGLRREGIDAAGHPCGAMDDHLRDVVRCLILALGCVPLRPIECGPISLTEQFGRVIFSRIGLLLQALSPYSRITYFASSSIWSGGVEKYASGAAIGSSTTQCGTCRLSANCSSMRSSAGPHACVAASTHQFDASFPTGARCCHCVQLAGGYMARPRLQARSLP